MQEKKYGIQFIGMHTLICNFLNFNITLYNLNINNYFKKYWAVFSHNYVKRKKNTNKLTKYNCFYIFFLIFIIK